MSDLISRAEAIKVLKSNYDLLERATLRTDKARRDEISAMMAKIISLPSAEPKTGKWVDCRRGCNYYANCSNCGMQIDAREKGGYPNFCENCGADMRGEEE